MKSVFLVLLTLFLLFSIPAVGEEVEYIYHWERQFYGSLDGREFLLHNRDLSFAKLAFGDLDGDHNPDLLAGSTDGHISLFMNTGTPDSPRWQLTEEHLRAVKHVKEKGVLRRVMREIELTGHTAPFLVDIDQDQDMDLFVGDQQGRLIFYRNIGTPSLSAFEETSPSLVDKDFGTFLVPTLADVDRDGDEDLVVGTKGGDVFLVINQGDKKKAAFCIRRSPTDQEEVEDGTTVSLAPCRPLPRRIASIAPEKNAAPGLVDWDEDGLPDLFVGQSNGGIYFFPNKGTPTAPLWKASQRKFLSIDEGGYASPVFLDINRDHHPDLLSGSGTNQVFAYTTQGTKSHLDVWEVTPNFLSINRLGGHSSQVVVTTGDLDGDNDPDLILGTKEGRVMLFTNTGTAKKAAWALTNDNLFPEPSRKNAAPLLVDIDQDKDLDLIIGGLNGRLILVLNTGSAKKPRWELETTAFAGVDVGSNSVAAATDLDGDGDLDLFVGNNQGRVVFFQNNGPPANPSFSLVSTHFANTMGAKGAHPAFMDWNEDGRPDLLVGDSQGKLTLYLNQNEKGEPPRRWNPTPTAFGEQWVAGNSAPHLNDLNGDKRPDLLVGDGQGNLLVWLNMGSEKISLNPADPPPPPEDSEPPPPEKDGELLAGEETVPIVTGPIPPAMALVDKNWGGFHFGGKASPALADTDGDGDLDLVVGTHDGKLIFFRNNGTPQEPEWKKETESLGGYDQGKFPVPSLADMDGDGKPDLLVGTEDGRVLFYRNTPDSKKGMFTLDAPFTAGVRVGSNAAPIAASLNGDSQPDLLIGNFHGNLVAYLNLGPGKTPRFQLFQRRFMSIDVGMGAIPFIGDLDHDDNPDLLLGSDQGYILNFKKGTPTVKNRFGWTIGMDYLKNLKFPRGSAPVLADIDGDGDMDLLVGTDAGVIYLYRNEANPQARVPASLDAP